MNREWGVKQRDEDKGEGGSGRGKWKCVELDKRGSEVEWALEALWGKVEKRWEEVERRGGAGWRAGCMICWRR